MKMPNRFNNKFTGSTFAVQLNRWDTVKYTFHLKPRHNWRIGQVISAQEGIRKILQHHNIKELKTFCKIYELQVKIVVVNPSRMKVYNMDTPPN